MKPTGAAGCALVMGAWTAAWLTICPALAAAEEKVSFNQDIRPILSDKCFHCHGFDEKERKGELRLDLPAEALKGGKSGPVIVPRKPLESELMKRVLTTDPDEVMPPPKRHKAVTGAEAELLSKWISQGAEYQGHWAFIKPGRPTPPSITANPIDAFILEKLTAAGLTPSAPASKETLIRRVTHDLTGLPPSRDEVAAFLADTSPKAYETLVDRLLASPRYGEHMATRWLDMARYADSNGFQSDTSRQMWPWREWLIRSLNNNLPFDQFTIHQLAGDMLPNATKDQIMATGFQRNHRLNGEGGRIVEEWFAETVIDRVETTGMTWMALTLNCCRCHDHKYDPITQKEFYQLFAYFNSVDELGVMDDFGGAAGTRKGGNSRPVLDLPTPEQEAATAAARQALQTAEAGATAAKAGARQRQGAWEKEMASVMTAPQQVWHPLVMETATGKNGATLTKQTDGTWLAGGEVADHEIYEITAPITAAGAISGILLECLPDASLPAQSVGRNSNGNFVLSDVDVAIISSHANEAELEAALSRAEADFSQADWDIKTLVDGKPERKKAGKGKTKPNPTGWAVDGPTRKEPSKAAFVFEAPLQGKPGDQLRITLRHEALPKHSIGKFRISTSGLPGALLSVNDSGLDGKLRAALTVAAGTRTPEQQNELDKVFRGSGDAVTRAAEMKVAAAKKQLGEADAPIQSVMVLKETAQPRDAFILNRGEYDKPGEKVSRDLPKALPGLPAGAQHDRLGFAKWLVSGEHPLTARVWVNRAWESFFGTGIVKTSENFGSQAEWPSHPALLDWLATEFVQQKWDMKAMHRLIVTSDTYRQSSAVTPELLARDGENRLLSRAPRLRLSGESLRDQALYVSGLLVEKIGGPSVRPYMPAAVWDETSVYGDMRNYMEDTDEGLYRRTLYTIWKRTAAPPSMLLFDSPSREICTVKRSRSNTPAQALSLLNEVTYVEAARKLAERMILTGGGSPQDRISWGFESVTSRKPNEFEAAQLLKGLQARLAKYAADPNAARELLKQGKSPAASGVNPTELAAYTVTANVLLNLDEVVTRD
jgi:Protein of unknown function (DUF1553)/Protein of unknown function (DUF1549)/Planctomycete cytochrome C